MTDYNELLTTSQAADLIGLSGPESVVKFISRKKISAYKFGRQWLILRSEAERYRDERAGKGGRRKKSL